MSNLVTFEHTIRHRYGGEMILDNGIETLVSEVTKRTGASIGDIVFSGYSEIHDTPEAVDAIKLADTSAEQAYLDNLALGLDHEAIHGSWLNTHQLAIANFNGSLESRLPEPDARIRRLKMKLGKSRNPQRIEEISKRIKNVEKYRARVMRMRSKELDAFEETLQSISLLPIYYGGDVESLSDGRENNPISYATEQYTEDGFLVCYSRARLEQAGVEVLSLDSTTNRDDRQLYMPGTHSMLEKGKIALITLICIDADED